MTQWIKALLVTLATTIVMLALLEALRRRGIDPVGALASIVSPSEAA